jgi:hypothetical protein
MAIPKPRSEVIFDFVVTAVVVSFSLLAVVDSFLGIAAIAAIFWLGIITLLTRQATQEAGGLRQFLINRSGDLFGKRFIDCEILDEKHPAIRLGFHLLGHRFIQRRIGINKIESVHWIPGQATDMAGRDVGDWCVFLYYDHDDPAKSAMKRKWSPKPDQDIIAIGPSTRKERTEALGLKLLDFLRDSGAKLVPGATPACFVRPCRDLVDL